MQLEVQWCGVVALVGDDGDPRGMLAFDVACIPNGSIPAQRASIRTQTLDWDPDPARIATARRRTWKGDPTLDARALSRIRGDTTCAGSVTVLVAVVWREPSRKLALGFPVLRLRYCLRLGRTRRCGLCLACWQEGREGLDAAALDTFCCFVQPLEKWKNPGRDRHARTRPEVREDAAHRFALESRN